MRKKLSMLGLTVCLGVSIGLTGCGSKEAVKTEKKVETEAVKEVENNRKSAGGASKDIQVETVEEYKDNVESTDKEDISLETSDIEESNIENYEDIENYADMDIRNTILELINDELKSEGVKEVNYTKDDILRMYNKLENSTEKIAVNVNILESDSLYDINSIINGNVVEQVRIEDYDDMYNPIKESTVTRLIEDNSNKFEYSECGSDNNRNTGTFDFKNGTNTNLSAALTTDKVNLDKLLKETNGEIKGVITSDNEFATIFIDDVTNKNGIFLNVFDGSISNMMIYTNNGDNQYTINIALESVNDFEYEFMLEDYLNAQKIADNSIANELINNWDKTLTFEEKEDLNWNN